MTRADDREVYPVDDDQGDGGWRSYQVGRFRFRFGVQTARGVCPTTGEPSGVRYLTVAFSRDRRVTR